MFEQNHSSPSIRHTGISEDFLPESRPPTPRLYCCPLFSKDESIFRKKGHHPDISIILYKIPEVIFQFTLPYAVLLATLLTLGILPGIVRSPP